jgi:hypothetical protein
VRFLRVRVIEDSAEVLVETELRVDHPLAGPFETRLMDRFKTPFVEALQGSEMPVGFSSRTKEGKRENRPAALHGVGRR